MKILYGVNGEGLGHAMRSAVVGEHLASRGHCVTYACGRGRASKYLSRSGAVALVPSFGSKMVNNKVRPLATLISNLPAAALSNLSPIFLAGLPRPDVVISDFEPCVARYAKMFGIPLLSIGNIEFISRCAHPTSVVDRASASLALPIVENVVPGAQHYFVTTFANAPLRKMRTSLHLPILRPEILNMARHGLAEDTVIVYFNDKTNFKNVIRCLQAVPSQRFNVYGSPARGMVNLGNVKLYPMSDGFMSDLIHSKAVIGGAGFTLLTEALYNKKPMLAVPFQGHFEQIINANYLHELGYGSTCSVLTPEAVASFLKRTDDFAERLSTVKHDNNHEILSQLDSMLGS